MARNHMLWTTLASVPGPTENDKPIATEGISITIVHQVRQADNSWLGNPNLNIQDLKIARRRIDEEIQRRIELSVANKAAKTVAPKTVGSKQRYHSLEERNAAKNQQ